MSLTRPSIISLLIGGSLLLILPSHAAKDAELPSLPSHLVEPPEDAIRTPSGLAYQILKHAPASQKPKSRDTVVFHATVWTADGKLFESSRKTGQPRGMSIQLMTPGMAEGIQLMSVAAEYRFWIPARLAYGDASVNGNPGGALVCDIELLEILDPPVTPEDIAAPAADALKTASGLAHKLLKKGDGTLHPKPNDKVRVHYSGWTSDGKRFTSTYESGQAGLLEVNRVIKGWAEGLQLMVEGEKRRLWIPADLAYGIKPRGGKPTGMLVFDLELREIVPGPPSPPNISSPPADALKTATGLAHKVLKPGEGKNHPEATDFVRLHYDAWTLDGKLYRSSRENGGKPSYTRLNSQIEGWIQGIPLMVVGETRRFWVPPDLSYHNRSAANASAVTLVYDIELLEIQPAPIVPNHLKAPPQDAVKTDSGLAFQVLRAGSGTQHPELSQTVRIHYTGWSKDGVVYDSSVIRGEEAVFPLKLGLKAFIEGIPLMVCGEKRRFWVPPSLAFGDTPPPGKPAGPMVFDVELIEIKAN